MSDNHPCLLVGYWTSAVARCVCVCACTTACSRAVLAACCPCQTLPVMFLHANCRSARDARFHERNLKQQHVDTLAQQLGVDANTVIVCGGGFMGTNKPGKGTEPGGGGCKVRLLCLLCLLCLFANRPVVACWCPCAPGLAGLRPGTCQGLSSCHCRRVLHVAAVCVLSSGGLRRGRLPGAEQEGPDGSLPTLQPHV